MAQIQGNVIIITYTKT